MGEITLGGLFPLHTKSEDSELECGKHFRPYGYQIAQGMLYAVAKLNENENILPDISLKAKIYDTCRSETIAAGHTKEFIKMTIEEGNSAQLAGVVGAAVSDVSAKVASILQVFEIPQISHFSTSVLLSDRDIYSYFLRTVPPDTFQAQAMIDITLKFGWTYVLTVSSEGIYGSKGIEKYHELAKENGICTDHIGTVKRLSNTKDYEEIVGKMIERSKDTGVSAVILFCSLGHSYGITTAAEQRTEALKFTWIASDAWDTTSTHLNYTSVLMVNVAQGEAHEEFKSYFKKLNAYNPSWKDDTHLEEFWEDYFQCKLTKTSTLNVPMCSGKENLLNVTFGFVPVRTVVNAVHAFAHALDSLQRELCPNQTGMCAAMSTFQRKRLLDHLKNVSFQDFLNTTVMFNKNGEVNAMYDIINFQHLNTEKRHVRVGTWEGGGDSEAEGNLAVDIENIKWNNGNGTAPSSHCSVDCPFGYVKRPRSRYDFACCWTCHQCRKLQIIVNNTCLDGQVGYVPNANKTAWIKREVLYLKWSGGTSAFLIAISLLSVVLTLFTLSVFCFFHNHRTVKASGRELCYIILGGILLCSITPFLYIAKPNDALCYARKSCTGLAMAMCYAALFMKINRVYRVFTSAMTTIRRPALVRPKSQILVTIGLISIQLMFTALWFIVKPAHAVETYYSDKEELILECTVDPISFMASLSYVIVLMILCTVYAFKTRKFPKNFNESRYIGITLYTTSAVSVLLFAFFLNTKNKFTEDYLIAGGSVLLGLINLFGLFAQRIFIILFVKDLRVEDRSKMPLAGSGTTNGKPVITVKEKAKDLYMTNVDEKTEVTGTKRKSASF